jgi:hypothetical protein
MNKLKIRIFYGNINKYSKYGHLNTYFNYWLFSSDRRNEIDTLIKSFNLKYKII